MHLRCAIASALLVAASAGCSAEVTSQPEHVKRATALPRAADAPADAASPAASADGDDEPFCMYGCSFEDNLPAHVDPRTGMRPLRWVISRIENADAKQAALEKIMKPSIYALRECLEKVPSARIPSVGRVRLGVSLHPGGKLGSVRLLSPDIADPEGCFSDRLRRAGLMGFEWSRMDVVVHLERVPAQANVRVNDKLLHNASIEDVEAAVYEAGLRPDAGSITEEKPGYHRIRASYEGQDIVIVFVAAPKREARTFQIGPLGHVSNAELRRWMDRGAIVRSGGALLAVESPGDKAKAATLLELIAIPGDGAKVPLSLSL